jgi:hypothetical protein
VRLTSAFRQVQGLVPSLYSVGFSLVKIGRKTNLLQGLFSCFSMLSCLLVVRDRRSKDVALANGRSLNLPLSAGPASSACSDGKVRTLPADVIRDTLSVHPPPWIGWMGGFSGSEVRYCSCSAPFRTNSGSVVRYRFTRPSGLAGWVGLADQGYAIAHVRRRFAPIADPRYAIGSPAPVDWLDGWV